MIYNVVGDLLKQDKVDIICHQTNCKGVMGAGIALQIKKTYPEFVNCNDQEIINKIIEKYFLNSEVDCYICSLPKEQEK